MASKALIAASAKPIILSLLLTGESYGYRILERVRQVTGGKLEWSSAMLYPVLHRLEKDGLIRSQWELSDEGRMRKYYSLTVRGREALTDEKADWMDIHKALARLWKPVGSSD
jgi:PadR family transcriptional regulator, regulatory protein PadR